MTFDNSKTIISIRIKLFAATVLLLGWLALAYIGKVIDFPFLGMSDTFWTILFIAVYFVIAFVPVYLSYQFISYSDEEDKIVFRYFSAGIVGGRKNSVEIDKRLLTGYRTDYKLFGLKQSITLFQQFKDGIAKYPPIYISALTKEEKAKLITSLNLLTNVK